MQQNIETMLQLVQKPDRGKIIYLYLLFENNLFEKKVPKEKKTTKICSYCKQQIDSTDFADHVQSCSDNQMDEQQITTKKKEMKYCGLCKQDIDGAEYRNHVATCSKKRKETKYCGLCKQDIDGAEYRNHVASCSKNRSSTGRNDSTQSSMEVNLFVFIYYLKIIYSKKGFEREKNKIM
jgi:hypothetical protein